MVVDQISQEALVPLNQLRSGSRGLLEVANSNLTEFAAMGFEYGFSVESPKCLNILYVVT